jgi:acyl dehydratase
MEKQLLTFEKLPKGRCFESLTERVTEEMIKAFGEAIETENPYFRDKDKASKSRFGDIIAPPMIAYLLFRHSYLANAKMPGGGIGLKMEFEFRKAVKISEDVTTKTHVSESYEKNGKKFITLEGITENVKGEIVYISRLSAIWPE